MNETARELLLFGPFSLRPDAVELRRNDRLITLRPKCFDLLVYFARNPGRLITVDELLSHVWKDVIVNEGTVNRTIAELRAAMGEDSEHPAYIETVSRRGYKFIAQIQSQRAPAQSNTADETAGFALIYREKEFPLRDGEHLIGRGPDVAIPLYGSSVSRHHARVVVSGASLTLEDLASRNGTYVNGTRVAAAVALNTGDEIRIGNDRIVVWARHAATRSAG